MYNLWKISAFSLLYLVGNNICKEDFVMVNNSVPEPSEVSSSQQNNTRKIDEVRRIRIFEEIKDYITNQPSTGPNVMDSNSPVSVPRFRKWSQIGYQLPVFSVPNEFVLFRVESARIMEYKLYHEKNFGLDSFEKDTTQQLLREWNDEVVKKTAGQSSGTNSEQLRNLIREEGQQTPAIITADGILVDGNRRKLTLEQLYRESEGNPEEQVKFKYIKVVVLPGNTELEEWEVYRNWFTDRAQNIDRNAPYEWELDDIERRLQVGSDGKARYTNLQESLSLKKQIDRYRRDPESVYYDAEDKDIIKSILRSDPNQDKIITNAAIDNKYQLIQTLNTIDQFLEHIGDPLHYSLISDKEYYQASEDLSKLLNKKLKNQQWLAQHNIRPESSVEMAEGMFEILSGSQKDAYKNFRSINRIIVDPDVRTDVLIPLCKDLKKEAKLIKRAVQEDEKHKTPEEIVNAIEDIKKAKVGTKIKDELERALNQYNEFRGINMGIDKLNKIQIQINEFNNKHDKFLDTIPQSQLHHLIDSREELIDSFGFLKDSLYKQIELLCP